MQSEADKLRSSATNIHSDQDLIEIGAEDVAKEAIESAKRRREAFQKYYQLMDSVGSSTRLYTNVRPQSYPSIRLPSCGLTL